MRFLQILKNTYRRFVDDRCPRVAAALSFTSILALVPLLTVGISAMSMFPVFEDWTATFQDLIYKFFVPAAGDVVSEQLNKFVGNAGKLTTFGLLFLLLASLLALSTIEDAFNDIWRVSRGRSLVQRVLVYWAVLSLGPLLIVSSLSMSSYLLSMKIFTDTATLQGLVSFGLTLLPFVFVFVAFLLLYTAVPNHDVALKPALIGALIAAVAFEIAKRGFALYILEFGSYRAIYGALAALPIFLLWVYLCWLIVLTGVEFVVELSSEPSATSVDSDGDHRANDRSHTVARLGTTNDASVEAADGRRAVRAKNRAKNVEA